MAEKLVNENNSRLIFYIGIAAMIILVVGVFSEASSLLQKWLFLIGAAMLALVAYKNKLQMLFVLQVIIVLGSIMAFFQFGHVVKYSALIGAALIGVGYLITKKNYYNDRFGVICTVGLLLISAGMATDAAIYPLYFGLLLGIGAVLVAIYSFVDYFYGKREIAVIWFILNVIFAINPLMIAFSAITKGGLV